MRTPTPAADPWAPSDVDSGWRDLVVSSSPPPPPRDAFEPMRSPINSTLLADLHTWQDHGTGRATAAAVEEPTFSADDRRLWKAAGALMVLATLVLAALGSLTFGGAHAVESAPAAVVVPRPVEAAPAPPTHARPVSASSSTASAYYGPVNSPRYLKRTKHTHHHKPIASR
jgi:hypothetical protein